MRIGRGDGAPVPEVIIDNEYVSRFHLSLSQRGEHLIAQPERSSSGAFAQTRIVVGFSRELTLVKRIAEALPSQRIIDADYASFVDASGTETQSIETREIHEPTVLSGGELLLIPGAIVHIETLNEKRTKDRPRLRHIDLSDALSPTPEIATIADWSKLAYDVTIFGSSTSDGVRQHMRGWLPAEEEGGLAGEATKFETGLRDYLEDYSRHLVEGQIVYFPFVLAGISRLDPRTGALLRMHGEVGYIERKIRSTHDIARFRADLESWKHKVAPAESEDTFCFTNESSTPLTLDDKGAAKMKKRQHDFDYFVDATGPQAECSTRLGNKDRLTPTQLRIFAEFLVSRSSQQIDPRRIELATSTTEAGRQKAFFEMRRKVEGTAHGHGYRLFKKGLSDENGRHTYFFQPDEGLKYCFLLPAKVCEQRKGRRVAGKSRER